MRASGSVAGAALFMLCAATSAQAVVGGTVDEGPLSRATVMVLSSNGGVCSGIVLAADVVLTAAHCASGAAEHRVHFRDEQGQPILLEPSAKEIHPDYDAKAVERRTRSIDLAILRVPTPLPDRFSAATLSSSLASKDAQIFVGGYGAARENDARSTGTFRAAQLRVVKPYGPSKILVWAKGDDNAGACNGDSGGPISHGSAVFALTTWTTGAKGRSCGSYTQGILLGPQRDWIDRVLANWGRRARWD